MLDNLDRQTLAPVAIMICCTTPDDVGAVANRANVTVVYDQPGTSRQRNRILRILPKDIDWIVFFDDDFYPDPHWLETVSQAFRDDALLSCVTGQVVADGVRGPGLTPQDALASIAAHDRTADDWVIEDYSPYGCNMAFRRTAIDGLLFDERLVLYGWLEDRDFGSSLVKRGGKRIKLGRAFGVHLGVKGGRVTGRKFGYSQVMNPIYMHRKGTMTKMQVIDHIGRNVLSNLIKSLRPEAYIDRRGRLIGNFIAFLDLARFRFTPERASFL